MGQQFYSNGKLLLTGEYAVLDGALALAVPTKYGQSLEIKQQGTDGLLWKSYDQNKKIWFEAQFDLPDVKVVAASNSEMGITLQKLLLAVRLENPKFLQSEKGVSVTMHLSFPKDWGLGTSSTLINNIAEWGKVNPYFLLEKSFGGSGYDIACAKHDTPITYQLKKDSRTVKEVNFNPDFKNNLYFVYLNRKQNSREAIQNYRGKAFDQLTLAHTISALTENVIKAKTLNEFEGLLKEHEAILSKTLQVKTVQEQLFSNYKEGIVKSLGGWGGDFVLATGNEKTPEYFKSKGFDIVIPYKDMTIAQTP